MNLETFVTTYGYPALFTGVFLEGESVLLIAGFLAHNGYLNLLLVILVAFAGAFCGDQFFFRIGRHKGIAYLKRRPHLRCRVDAIGSFLHRYQIVAVLGYRFMYGMRTITPIILGASRFSASRFALLNLCSTLLWAAVIATAGYFFGEAIHVVLKDVKHYEVEAVLLVALFGSAIWLYRWLREKMRHKSAAQEKDVNPTA
jgi:membrane protein DedA with SNARE-associated domain